MSDQIVPASSTPASTDIDPTGQPTQTTGQLKVLQGQVYDTVGKYLPEGLGAQSWKDSASTLDTAGKEEVDKAKKQQAIEAVIDRAAGTIKTAIGWAIGDQGLQTAGNEEAMKAAAAYKQAKSDKVIDPPAPSAEGLGGLKDIVVGAVTGDQELQSQGNLRAQKAELKDGI